jgi:hypothetical protein
MRCRAHFRVVSAIEIERMAFSIHWTSVAIEGSSGRIERRSIYRFIREFGRKQQRPLTTLTRRWYRCLLLSRGGSPHPMELVVFVQRPPGASNPRVAFGGRYRFNSAPASGTPSAHGARQWFLRRVSVVSSAVALGGSSRDLTMCSLDQPARLLAIAQHGATVSEVTTAHWSAFGDAQARAAVEP